MQLVAAAVYYLPAASKFPTCCGCLLRYLLLHHLGIPIVPSESDCEKQLVRRSVKPGLHVQRFKGAPGSGIIRAMALNLQLPWLELLDSRNLLQFQTLLDGFQKSRLMRITYYKEKGVEDAN